MRSSTQLAREFASVDNIAGYTRLMRELGERRTEIESRLRAITPSRSPSLHPHPIAWQKASIDSPAAMKKLTDEAELITIELDHLASLEVEAIAHSDRIQHAERLREGTKALKAVGRKLERLSEAMADYDAALADANATLEAIAGYVAESNTLPWGDSELANLLRAREAVWSVRTLAVPVIAEVDDRTKFPESWPLLFEAHSHYGDEVAAYHHRRPPEPHRFPDAS